MSQLRRLLPSRDLWLLLILTIPAVLPLTAPGYFFDAHDAHHSVFFLVEFDQAIRDGVLWPRWAPDAALGFGYPLWLLFAPLAYYVAELFHLLGTGFTTAVKLTWALSTFLAAGSMYALARRWWGRAAGLVAALIYAYAPYHLLNMYVRADLAEYVALSLFPLVLLTFWSLIANRGLRRVAIAALAYSALILSHSVSMLIFTPFLGAFIIVALFRGAGNELRPTEANRQGSSPSASRAALLARFGPIGQVAGAILLAIGLCSVFLFPLLAERAYIVQEQWVQGTYQYQHHFVYLNQLLSSFWDYGYAVAGPEDGMSFQLGLLPAVLASVGTLAALRRPSRYRIFAIFFAAVTFVAMWLMTASSQALWSLAPLAALVQFPWRLLAVTSFTLALLSGYAINAAAAIGHQSLGASEEPEGTDACLAAPHVLLILIVLASFPYTRPEYTEATSRDESPAAIIDFELEFPDMRGMTAWSSRMPQPEDSPLVAQYLAGQPLTKANILQGDGQIRAVSHGGASEELTVASAAGMRLQFYTYWFPGWQVRIDDQPIESWPEGPNGLITFDVPPGDHRVSLRMTDGTLPRRAGSILSGLSLTATVVGLSVAGWRGWRGA